MDPVATRLLEEWKANNDLLKFYEDLKQKRFAHFLTIQTAFLAVFGLLARDALDDFSMASLTAFVLISIPPLVICFYFMRVDLRSRAFIDTMNTRLLMLEQEWQAHCPDNHFSTYGELFAVLSRRDADTIARYVKVRGMADDPYAALVQSNSAHRSEHAIMRLFWYLWLVLLSFATVVHAGWHVATGSWSGV